ncbi:DUF4381 domain-containing protein [Persicobacter diffluens]|uniref:DUF4381 domain-containing protein n=1 Tax=Persicobacter diffluens TaxID=981 RepID=A0AAN4VWZ4_9BACT|nr:hypothetical protein PEDI_10040 [Persicobacter diffluens]
MSTMQSEIEIGHLIRPEPIQQDFSTLGWSVLFVLIFIIVLTISILAIRKYQKNRYRREATKALQSIENTYQQNDSSPEVIQATNRLLKQVAITAYGRVAVASLFGQEWVNFLNEQMKKRPFAEEDTLSLINYHMYQKSLSAEAKPLVATFIQQSKKWIHGHEL